MKRIVVPTDFSPESERAFAPAVEWARRFGVGLAVLHVVREPALVVSAAPGSGSPLPMPDLDAICTTADVDLRGLRDRFDDVDVHFEVRLGMNPAQTIADYAREIGAVGIAIATHGRTGLRRFVIGSVAENVVRRASCPVTCFPPA